MAPSALRQPRSLVRVNGVVMSGWVDWEIDANSHYQADTFRVVFAVSGLPAANGMDWWSAQDQLEVEIFAGFPADPANYSVSDLVLLIYGRADEIDWHLNTGTFTLDGRDLTAELIDTKTSQKYPNNTSSQIATILATNHGLTPVVTATKTKAGKFYEIDHVRLQDERSEWDLLTWLAREEGYVVYVKGQELHFEPRATTPTVYPLNYTPPVDGPAQGNWTRLSLLHSLTLAKDITVYVRSWHMKSGKAFTAKAEAKRVRNRVIRNAGKPVTPTQSYYYTFAGLQPDQAQQKANQILADLSKHEVKLSLDGPADVTLDITHVLSLTGTGTGFDQTFYPDSITRSFNEDEGLLWRIEAKNHSPEAQPPV